MSRPSPDKSAETERHASARKLVMEHPATVESASREELRFAVATRCGGERFFRSAVTMLSTHALIARGTDKRWRLAGKAAA